ncbi:hypothetical protein KKB18_04790 [bacterium]|nr:hypothetical protein [bacterium]
MQRSNKSNIAKFNLVICTIILLTLSAAASGLLAGAVNNSRLIPSSEPQDDHSPPLVVIISPVSGITISGLVWVKIAVSDESGIDSVILHVESGSFSEDHPCSTFGIFWQYLINADDYPDGIQLSLQASAKDLSPNANWGFSSIITLGISSSPLHFNLRTKEDSPIFVGNSFHVILDVLNGTNPQLIDFYFIMIHPSGRSYAAWNWSRTILPATPGISILSEANIQDLIIFEGKIPSREPPILDFGIYTFAVAAVKSGTYEFVSNIATASIDVW